MTGETGAGKSIIFDAIQLLQGSRANSDMIRTGKRSASVEGKYVLSPFEFARIYPTLVELGCCDFDGFNVQSNSKKSMYNQVEDTVAKYFESISRNGNANTVVSKEISQQNTSQSQKEQDLSTARILELKLDLKLYRSGMRKSPVPLPSLSSILLGK